MAPPVRMTATATARCGLVPTGQRTTADSSTVIGKTECQKFHSQGVVSGSPPRMYSVVNAPGKLLKWIITIMAVKKKPQGRNNRGGGGGWGEWVKRKGAGGRG